ncbi:MAG: cytochrome c3 family protein [Chloroflexi bacterium]|nr:cytochrome c3 family protein [Chloroflexota bacterium]
MLTLITVAVTAGRVWADGGPHGGYDRLMDGTVGPTDKCAVCHRPHQGLSTWALLKRTTPYGLCVSCHDGAGSRLDVLDGVKLGTVLAARQAGITVTNGTLNGGGFEYVNGVAVTSKHNLQTSIDGPGETEPWGYYARTGEKNYYLGRALTCTSCHNPHGSPNYRILRQRVNGYRVSVLAYAINADGADGFTKQEGGPGLDAPNYPNIPSDKYVTEYYGSAGLEATGGYQPMSGLASQAGDPALNGFALLCGACHTTYPSSNAKTIPVDDPWGLGTNPAKYRHRTEMRYDLWQSSKYGGPVPNNPETNPYDPGSGALPALRLASNTTDLNKIVTCLTCHRAHGTATQVTGFALSSVFGGSSPDPLSPAQQNDAQIAGGGSVSTLLYTDNRAMCEACHQW